MAGDFLREARKSAELAAGALPSAARWRLVSDLRLADRDARGAEIAARNALELEPSDAAAMTLLARCRLVAGEDEEAKRLLIKASEIEPSCAAAFDNLAQIDALGQAMRIKLEQADNKIRQSKLKVQSDSIKFVASQTEVKVARDQLQRGEQQFEQGLVSKVEVEKRRVNEQKALAGVIDAENQLLASRNELLNAQLELGGIRNDYRDKLAKAESEKFASMSQMYTTEAEVTKMQVDLANYTVRAGNYYITAPQTGYITQAVKTGLGELIKEGESLISIMPADFDLAVELYVRPMDVPLVNKGQKVRFMFDGWPSIVFSGWPNTSYGTFGGQVVAIDNFVSPNGKYRILVAPDPDDQEWPVALRVGSGAIGFALLKDVPIWYELWRQLNGFPPDLYVEPASIQVKADKGSK